MRRFILSLILLLLCASGQAASLLSVQSATQTYSVIATTTADSVPTPRYAIKGVTDTYYTPLEASPASAGPRISIGGVTYGLASRTPAIGGNISLVRDASGTWVCHTFLTSGDFEVVDPAGIATCEYLIVAGGGGGGMNTAGNASGGGGAGGLLTNVGTSTPMVLSAGKYAATVGAGGTASSTAVATNGSDSTFNSLTAVGGGRGGGVGGVSGGNGGSGGGAHGTSAFGTGTAGQGTDGSKRVATSYGAGGGGGAGAAATSDGPGGAGLESLIRGRSEFFAGGGSPGATWELSGNIARRVGGIGGGGDGAWFTLYPPTAGTQNTGGGGGGAYSGVQNKPGIGGSGIVIVRYLIEE